MKLKKINYILISFLLMVMLTIFGIWKMIQTKYVADKISNKISYFVSQKISSNIKFEKLEFNFIPAGVTLKNVSFVSDHEKIKEFSFYFNKLHINISPLDLFSSRLKFSEFILDDGMIFIDESKIDKNIYSDNQKIIDYIVKKINSLPESEDPLWVKKLKEFKSSHEIYQLLYENLPLMVNSLKLRNINIVKNNDEINVKNIELILKKSNIDLNWNIKNIDTVYLSQGYFNDGLNQIDGGLRYVGSKLNINSIHIETELSQCLGSGYILNFYPKFKDSILSLKNECTLDLSRVSHYSTIDNILGIKKGIAKVKSRIDRKFNEFKINADAELEDFISNVADAKSVAANITFDGNTIKINSGKLKSDKQYLILNKPFELMNFKLDKMVSTPIDATFYNLPTHNFLKSILSIIEPLEGEFNGHLEVIHEKPFFIFKINKPVRINNFALKFKQEGSAEKLLFLENSFLDLGPSVMKYQYVANDFLIDSTITGNDNFVKASGHVNGSEVDIDINQGQLNLNSFKHIAGVKVAGKLKDDIKIFGPTENVIFNFKGDSYKLGLFNFQLGNIKHEFEYQLQNNRLQVTKTEGQYKNSYFSGSGELNFNSKDIKLEYDIPKTNYSDAMEVLHPLVKDIPFLPTGITGEVSSKLTILGKLEEDKLIYTGYVRSKTLQFMNENFKSFKMNFNLENNILDFKNIQLVKELGALEGNYQYNTKTSDFDYGFRIDRISIDEFSFIRNSPVVFNADLWGELNGGRKNGKKFLDGQLSLKNSNYKNIKLENSKIVFSMNDEDLSYDLKFLGDNITSEGDLYLSEGNMQTSNFVFNTNINNPSLFFSILFGKWLKLDELGGNIQLTTKLDFIGKKFEQLNAISEVRDFDLFIKNKKYQYLGNPEVLKIVQGDLKFLDFNVEGPGSRFNVQGAGNLKNGLKIEADNIIDANIFESILKGVISSTGKIKNSIQFFFKESERYKFKFNSKSDDFFIHIDSIPTIFNKINYSITTDQDQIHVDYFDANLTSGKLKIVGDIFNVQNSIYPKSSLSYQFDQAGFTYLGKTNATLSGKGTLSGEFPPYNLAGDFLIHQGTSYNELEDFIPKEKNLSEFDKYLPKRKGILKTDLVKFDLNFESENPLYIKNTTGEVNLNTNLLVKGSISQPLIGGKVTLIPGTSRFFFKSNDFILSRGFILFNEEEQQIDPELDILANSTIADYSVNMRIFGRSRSFNVDLASEPALSQNDILSLMTLGYTSDLSQNLASQDRTAMAQAGIGGLIFDRFRITEGLKNSLGLRLSVSPEFREGAVGGSMLSGRGSTNTGSTGVNVRSGTKVELRKKISEKVDLAVSSTVGASIGQRQSMNLNYNFNKNVGAEGVYEIRTNDEGVEDVIATSLGGDIKLKWNFK